MTSIFSGSVGGAGGLSSGMSASLMWQCRQPLCRILRVVWKWEH
jgi:hypothetical protein